MSADREALLERFRAGLLARIERIDSLLEQTGENGSVDALRKEALGELHTLKGEGRMLGLGSLSDVAHSLESFLGQDGSTTSALRTLDAMRKALAPGVAREIADAVLEAARLELGSSRSLPRARSKRPRRLHTPRSKRALRRKRRPKRIVVTCR